MDTPQTNEYHLTNGEVTVTSQMLEDFQRDGYIIIRKLLDTEEVGKVMKVLDVSDIRTHEYGTMGVFKGKRKQGRHLSSYVKWSKFQQTKDPTKSPARKKKFVLNYSPIGFTSTPYSTSKKKVPTPKTPKSLQSQNTKRKLSFDHENENMTFPFSPQSSSESFNLSSDIGIGELSVLEDGELKYLNRILPSVLKTLDSVGKRETFIKFLELVHEGKFPLTNIAFTLFCDVVCWYGLTDTRFMRYSQETFQFFWVGRKLFGGRFIRFMTGMKNENAILTGCAGLDPQEAKLNFACPSENALREINPFGDEFPSTFKPGFLEDVMELKAKKDDSKNSYVIMFDGKKVKRGGDVDLLGHEDSKDRPLPERIEEREKALQTLKRSVDVVEAAQKETNIICETSSQFKGLVYSALIGLILLFSATLQTLRTMKVKKQMSLNKLKDKAGEGDWRKSTYAHAIDACKTNIYKIENTTSSALQVQKSICKAAASINNVSHLFAESGIVDLQYQSNLRLLKEPEQIKEDIQELDTAFIKQRSEKWFIDRKTMKVTGSTIYRAVGCESLKAQKEHYDQVIGGMDPPVPSKEQESAMKYGTESEVHEVGTMCSVVMPVLFPDLIFHEEGYYIRDNILVSPDGSMKTKDSSEIEYAFEGKAPTSKPYSTQLHYRVPDRYIPQTLFEQRMLNASGGTIYMSWTEESCTVYRILQNEPICQSLLEEINAVYLKDNPSRPKSLTQSAKELKRLISDYSGHCIFLGEFPAVKGSFLKTPCNSSSDSPYILPKERFDSRIKMTYDELLKHLLLGKDILMDTYELQRPVASQVIVYLLADLDRLWKAEEPHAIPVTYFFRGYSLSMDVMRRITRDCKQRCLSKGLDVVACAADGEFSQLMVRGDKGNPLTQYQLSRDVWGDVGKMSKLDILSQFEKHCKTLVIRNNQVGQTFVNKVITVESLGGKLGRIKTPTKGWKETKNSKNADEVLVSGSQSSHVEQISEKCSEENVFENSHLEEHPVDIVENQTGDNELEDTILYEVTESEFTETKRASVIDGQEAASGPKILNIEEIKRVLVSADKKKWINVSDETLRGYCLTAKSLQKFTIKELSEITKIAAVRLKTKMKTSGLKKSELINQISGVISNGSLLDVVHKQSKVVKICTLKVLAGRAIKKKNYPKLVINIAYANFIWPDKHKEWLESACVCDKVDIVGLDRVLEPYYVPDKDSNTGDFELFVYDKTHLGSNLRKAICLDRVEGIAKRAWSRVSETNPEILNPTIIETNEEGKIVDQMKEKLARTLLSEAVEKKMNENGDIAEASFCSIFRGALYEAEDTPGITALERCNKRMNLIDWLSKDLNFGSFPPYGSKIKGMSTILYEGLRSSNEGKLYLYALAKKGTYCARAPNTLCSETFFGTMQEMDPWGQGVLSTAGVQKHMSDFITVTAMRMKDDRNFYIRTKKDAAYPVDNIPTVSERQSQDDVSVPTCSCRASRYIKCIIPRDHFFDTPERARMKKKEKPFKFSGTKGDLPVRAQYGYRINETKLLPSNLFGIKLIDD